MKSVSKRCFSSPPGDLKCNPCNPRNPCQKQFCNECPSGRSPTTHSAKRFNQGRPQVSHKIKKVLSMKNSKKYKTRIIVDEKVHFGKPCVAGTRIPVENVLELVQENITFDKIIFSKDITKPSKYLNSL